MERIENAKNDPRRPWTRNQMGNSEKFNLQKSNTSNSLADTSGLTGHNKTYLRKAVKATGQDLIRIQARSKILRVDRIGEYRKDPQLHTKGDAISESRICVAIRKVSNFPIMTEETGFLADPADFIWVLDPIDGSTQYHHGLPLYAISVALCCAKSFEAIWGIVYAPMLGLFYEASIGKGAFCSNRKIKSMRSKREDNLLVSISAFRSFERVGKQQVFQNLITSLSQVRQFGCPSLEICYVADGRLDARVVAGFKLWDVAAASLIAREAGCVFVTMEDGQPVIPTTQIAIAGTLKSIHTVRRAASP